MPQLPGVLVVDEQLVEPRPQLVPAPFRELVEDRRRPVPAVHLEAVAEHRPEELRCGREQQRLGDLPDVLLSGGRRVVVERESLCSDRGPLHLLPGHAGRRDQDLARLPAGRYVDDPVARRYLDVRRRRASPTRHRRTPRRTRHRASRPRSVRRTPRRRSRGGPSATAVPRTRDRRAGRRTTSRSRASRRSASRAVAPSAPRVRPVRGTLVIRTAPSPDPSGRRTRPPRRRARLRPWLPARGRFRLARWTARTTTSASSAAPRAAGSGTVVVRRRRSPCCSPHSRQRPAVNGDDQYRSDRPAQWRRRRSTRG